MNRRSFFVGLALVVFALPPMGRFAALGAEPGAEPPMAFRNPDLPVEARVSDLIGRLTVEEKIGQMMMASPEIARLGIPKYHWWNEALHGVARNGVATVFPQAIALAATWNPTLHGQIADAISTEARAKNNETLQKSGGGTNIYQGLTIWSPNINIFRDPRWGRGQETYGEDPFLTGRLAVAFVRGLQGDDPHYLKTAATLKHYVVHSGPEPLRHRFDAVVSERDLHETYLPAFEAGVREGGARSLMSAYNAVDGIPAPANRRLLTDILRDTWGFSGAVVGDVDTVGDIFRKDSHAYAPDAAAASALALKAGNDLCSGTTYRALPEALKRGLIDEADLDRALRRVFTVRFQLGQFDPPARVPYRNIPIAENNSPAHDRLALEAARQSLVLLKNDGALPWNPKEIKTLAILGPTADDSAALLGNYSGSPAHPVNLLAGLRQKLEPQGVRILFDRAVPLARGFRENGQPLPAGVLFTDATKTKPGLAGEVYEGDEKSSKAPATRTDAQIDLSWNEAQPAPGIPLRGARIRWQGVLVPPQSGEYVLSVSFIGAAQLFLDDKRIAGEDKSRDPGELRLRSTSVQLQAGQVYRIRLEYEQGANDPVGAIQFGWRTPGVQDLEGVLAKAREADHILLVLGITPALEGEEMRNVSLEGFNGGDRTSILLPAVQRELLDRVAALGKPFVVVLTNGSALSFDVSKPNAILDAWYYGENGGVAVAEALLGETNPAGRLPVTFYQSDKDLPAFTDYSMADRTYRYFTGKPLYAFGHGLSYTTFEYRKVVLEPDPSDHAVATRVGVELKNTGVRAGDEVVQVYARAVHPNVPRPLQWLVGFQRVHLTAGEQQTVTIPVKTESLRRWDEATGRYVVDAGEYEFRVGRASDRIEHAEAVSLPGSVF